MMSNKTSHTGALITSCALPTVQKILIDGDAQLGSR